jgi:hypothetical protein
VLSINSSEDKASSIAIDSYAEGSGDAIEEDKSGNRFIDFDVELEMIAEPVSGEAMGLIVRTLRGFFPSGVVMLGRVVELEMIAEPVSGEAMNDAFFRFANLRGGEASRLFPSFIGE